MIRLDKFLANCGCGSRAEVKNAVKKGRVLLNGSCVKASDCKVDPQNDEILLDGKPVLYEKYEFLMLNKPAGCVTALKDPVHQTVMEWIGSGHKADLSPVGRLDKDTEGLLLFVNDGDLLHHLLSPKHHVEKTYYAVIEGCVTPQQIPLFEEGLDIGEKKKTLPAVLTILSSGERSEIELTLHEGKYHQVKRMFEACGQKVLYLKRISMGGIDLDPSLAPGQWRRLTEDEIAVLRRDARAEDSLNDMP